MGRSFAQINKHGVTSGLIWLYEVFWDAFGDELLAGGGRFQRRLHSRVDLLLLLLRLLLVDRDHLLTKPNNETGHIPVRRSATSKTWEKQLPRGDWRATTNAANSSSEVGVPRIADHERTYVCSASDILEKYLESTQTMFSGQNVRNEPQDYPQHSLISVRRRR